jgi:hypothetical protein
MRAQIVKRLQIGTTKELVENTLDPEIIYEVEVPMFAEPGDVVDVTGWAHISSYVTNGSIFLLPAELPVQEDSQSVQSNRSNKGSGRVSHG